MHDYYLNVDLRLSLLDLRISLSCSLATKPILLNIYKTQQKNTILIKYLLYKIRPWIKPPSFEPDVSGKKKVYYKVRKSTKHQDNLEKFSS